MSDAESPPGSWFDDPLELDRTLEGELPAEALAARRAEMAADPVLRRRADAREAFLATLRRAGERWRARLADGMPSGLEARVREALLAGAPRARGGLLRWATAAAALLALGLGTAFWLDGGSRADAMPPEVLRAVDAARSTADEPRACADQGPLSPSAFPPVREGALRIWRCVRDERGTVAKLYRPEDLPSIGYAAVAEPEAGHGPDIGLTDLGDMIVFDVAYGRQRHYLAVPADWYRQQQRATPGRASCVACHNRSREGKANPHNIVKRSWALR